MPPQPMRQKNNNMPTIKMIRDNEIDAWLERASKWHSDTGMVADGIRLVERLIAENHNLRAVIAKSKPDFILLFNDEEPWQPYPTN